MIETGPGSGEYYLEIDPALEASFSPLFLSWENDLKNVFYFNFTITRDNGVDPVTSIDIMLIQLEKIMLYLLRYFFPMVVMKKIKPLLSLIQIKHFYK
jgi:hypothetical protein